MRLLCFADVHAGKTALAKLAKAGKSVDYLINAGDLSLYGSQYESSLKTLLHAGKKILMIPGNRPHETPEDVIRMTKKHHSLINIHKKVYRDGNYVFFGFGEGGFSFTAPGMEEKARQLKKHLQKDDKVIFVTHAPPYNTPLDYLPWMRSHRGCKTTIKVIKLLKPVLTICGHFHETAGKSCKVQQYLIINPGSHGRIVEI